MKEQIEQLQQFYADYGDADLGALNRLYHPDVEFRDPLHQLSGRDAVRAYFESGRRGLRFCRFEFSRSLVHPESAVLEWDMYFAHRRLVDREIKVEGCTLLNFCEATQQIVQHRDYFDLGEMIYENIPIFGKAVRLVKQQAGGGK